jgi:hypothetical protein
VFNPFAEVAEDNPPDAELVEQAQHGSRAALEKLALRHQAWVYNIAVRMVFYGRRWAEKSIALTEETLP